MNRTRSPRSGLRRPTALLTLCSALGMAACGSSTGPDEGAPVQRVAIEPVAAVLAAPGDSVRFTALGVRADGSEVTIPVTWLTIDPSVASIDPEGVARAQGTGITVVTATAESTVGFATIAVDPDTLPPQLVTAGVNATRVDVGVGPETVRFEAEFTDDRSGVKRAFAHFSGPFGQGINGLVSMQLVERVGARATFAGLLEVPAITGKGTWTLSLLQADDAFGNMGRWGTRELAEMGLTVQFEAVAAGG